MKTCTKTNLPSKALRSYEILEVIKVSLEGTCGVPSFPSTNTWSSKSRIFEDYLNKEPGEYQGVLEWELLDETNDDLSRVAFESTGVCK